MPEPRIKSDPKVMMGKPVVRGTRITLEHILRCLGAGDSEAAILRNHPQLIEADIRAAQRYAADYPARHGTTRDAVPAEERIRDA